MIFRPFVALAIVARIQALNHPHPLFRTATARYMSSSSPEVAPKRVLVPIGDGSEEIETTCITDTLTRFGAKVTVASVMSSLVCTMSRGIKVMADISIDEASKESWDLIALPGGMPGAEHLRDSVSLIAMLNKQKSEGKMYAAICASPAIVLASKGLDVEGITCYPAPSFRGALKHPVDDDVVVRSNLITSQGPGTSLQFALQLGEQLFGKEKADEIAVQMLVKR
jgi:protein deglycase